jgi:hypothetical protein
LGSAARRFRSPAALAAGALLAVFFGLTATATPAALKVSGTQFISSDGSLFEWRGITAFGLLEFVAHGKDGDADAYLAWAALVKRFGKPVVSDETMGAADVAVPAAGTTTPSTSSRPPRPAVRPGSAQPSTTTAVCRPGCPQG